MVSRLLVPVLFFAFFFGVPGPVVAEGRRSPGSCNSLEDGQEPVSLRIQLIFHGDDRQLVATLSNCGDQPLEIRTGGVVIAAGRFEDFETPEKWLSENLVVLGPLQGLTDIVVTPYKPKSDPRRLTAAVEVIEPASTLELTWSIQEVFGPDTPSGMYSVRALYLPWFHLRVPSSADTEEIMASNGVGFEVEADGTLSRARTK